MESELGTKDISKLILKQSIPAIIGMLIMSIHNITDAMFVGRGVGSLGIAATSVSFPIHMIFSAFLISIGVGGASIISRNLGSKHFNIVKKTIALLFVIVAVLNIFFQIIFRVFQKDLLYLFGATDSVFPYASDYFGTLLYGLFFLGFMFITNNMLRSFGHAKASMIVMLVSAVTNIILDPIFIFVLKMGMKGAALATVISQIIATVISFYLIFKYQNKYIDLSKFSFDFHLIKELIFVSSPTFVRQFSMSVVVGLLNQSIVFYGGVIALSSYGIINRVFGFVIMPLFGFAQGLQPVLGFNYGAKKMDRSKDSILKAVKYSTFVSVFFFVLIMVLTRPLVSLFTTEIDLINMTTFYLRVATILFPFLGFIVVSAAAFQAIGKVKESLFLSLSRQVIFLLPLLLIIPRFLKLDGVYISLLLSDLLSGIVTFILIRKLIASFKENSKNYIKKKSLISEEVL